MSETPVSGSGGIGSGGEGLRGRKVGKAPRYDSRYTINSARQDEPGSWIYLLVGALGNQVEVKGDDPAYRLAERSAEALAMDTFVLQKLADVPAGRVEDWVPRPADTGSGTSPSFDPRSFAQSVSMGKGTSTANQASRYILWSGGAADCLIVAARGAGAD